MGVERLDQLGEVGKRTRQPIDLVDNDDVHLALPHLGEELLQSRAIQRCAGQSAVVIALGREPPAFVGLALHIGLAGLALRIERVESEVEVMLGRFAGVDGAALRLRRGRLHCQTSCPP